MLFFLNFALTAQGTIRFKRNEKLPGGLGKFWDQFFW
jgi:hypothetical protein